MTTAPREQPFVYRVHCADCGAPLMLWPNASTAFSRCIFAADCPKCGADVMQQPQDPALDERTGSFGGQQ